MLALRLKYPVEDQAREDKRCLGLADRLCGLGL